MSLYEAGVQSLVSEESATNVYQMIAKESKGFTFSSYKEALNETEGTIKKEFSLSKMPGPWRSAKSVVLSALRYEINLFDDNGNVVGKSEVQKAIKESKMEKVITPYDIACKALDTFSLKYFMCTEEERKRLRSITEKTLC